MSNTRVTDKILEKPYFSRVGIIQTIIQSNIDQRDLSPEMLCFRGFLYIASDVLQETISCWKNYEKYTTMENIMDIWGELYTKAQKEYHPEVVTPFIYAHHVADLFPGSSAVWRRQRNALRCLP